MPVLYKVVSTFRPGEGSKGERIWYPQLTGSTQIDLKRICKMIEKRSTFSGGDTIGVFYEFQELIPELLCSGYTIKIDGLGSFRLHAKVTTSNTEEEVTSHNIKEFRISFKPDTVMKEMLQKTKAEKI